MAPCCEAKSVGTQQRRGPVESIITITTGLLLITAGIAKVVHPDGFVVAIQYALSPMTTIGANRASVLAWLVVAGEVSLGLMLIASGRRRWRVVSAGVLVFFAVVLVARFAGHGSPPCACLGRFIAPGPAAAWVDAARNLCLAAALLLVVRAPASRDRPASANGNSHNAATSPSRGMSLVEMLVGVLVVAILAALAIPALAAARRSAQHARSILVCSQIHTVVNLYSRDNRDLFPAFANPHGGVSGPIEYQSRLWAVGYFRMHISAWPTLVANGDASAVPGVRHPMLSGTSFMATGLEETLFDLTAGAFASPAYFRPVPPEPSGEMIRVQRWSVVRFPSSKGLVLDAYWIGKGATIAGFFDGSAGHLSHDLNHPVAPVPGDGPRVKVISTLDGLHGRDR